MKLLIIIPDFPPEILGGTQTFTYGLAKFLSKKNDVIILTSGEKKRIVQDNKLKIIYAKKISSNKIISNLIRVFQFVFLSIKIKPDLVIGHLISSSAIAGIIVSKLKNKPLILRPGGFELITKKIYKKIFFYPILRLADGIVVQNQSIKEEIKKITKKGVIILPQGINLIKFKKQKPKNRCLYVGRFIPEKNIDVLFRIAKKMPNINFTLIGWGPLFKKFEKIKLKNVKLISKQPKEKVFESMKQNDIFLLPSKKESFGRVILEAMNFGLPVISTKVSEGPPTIITDGKDGILIKNEDDKDEYIQAINKIYSNYNFFSRNAFKKVKKYDWNKIIFSYENFYKKIIKDYKLNKKK